MENTVPAAYVVSPVRSGIAFITPNFGNSYDFSGNYINVNWKLGDSYVQVLNDEHDEFTDRKVENIWINWRHGESQYDNVITFR